MKIAVLGGGAWGTTLANVFAKKGHDTRLWLRNHDVLDQIKSTRENSRYLPGIALDSRLQADSDFAAISSGAECFILAVPCQTLRATLECYKSFFPVRPVMVCASKGIELTTYAGMSEVVSQTLEPLEPVFAMLSGPSFARETSREIPTTVALGCADTQTARFLQKELSTEYFRIYTSSDYRGVELGGALKNVIALAAGCADGLEFGSNARAALITRGLAEISRLGQAMGADPRTFQGLSGMGDLILTCTGDMSRNRQVGLALGRGKRLPEILAAMDAVAEGVKTTQAVYALGQQFALSLPVTEQLYAVLYEKKDPRQAVRELMMRTLKEE